MLIGVALVAAACGSAGGGTTTVTYVAVANGAISFGTTQGPTGCNPNTPAGDTPGTRTLLGAVLPSPYYVDAQGMPTPNPNLTTQSELVSTKPETIVYTLNPKAVWSDGVPITADDFVYAWTEQRGAPIVSSPDVTSIAGYRDIASVTGSNGGHTVTVKFKTTFADWQGLFDNLVPAHVMEKVGWNPTCPTVDPAIDLSGGPFKIAKATPQAISLVQNPKWWGTPANARSITVHIASSTDELAQWVRTGFVQVAQPATVTRSFLARMTSLPGVESDVDTSATMLQLQMASALDGQLSPNLREAIALTVNRQELVNQQASWAVPGLIVANSHIYVQGQPSYKPPLPAVPTTTVPVATSSTSTTVIGAGGSVNFPVTPVPTQAADLIDSAGLVKTPGDPYYHSAFGTPFSLRMVYDAGDRWATAAAPVIRSELADIGLDTSLYAASSASEAGQILAAQFADLAVMPVTFTPYMSQMVAWYSNLLGTPGKNGSQNWTNFSNAQYDQLVQTASQQLNPNTAATYYSQADTMLWDEMVSLPLYAEPAVLVWNRKVGGVSASPRGDSLLWLAQLWAVRVPESTSNTTPTLPGPP
jgi:peptide/nickel transport system substrate-binding protein